MAGNHVYDALDRLIATHYPATPALDVAYTWDTPAAGCVAPNRLGKGRLSSVTDASGSTAFCYNRYGDTAGKAQTIAGTDFPVSYVYNRDATLNSVTEPNGTVISYVRDSNARIKSVKYQLAGQPTATTMISAVAYNPFGPPSKITYGSGTTARPLSRTYDLDGIIKTIVDSNKDTHNPHHPHQLRESPFAAPAKQAFGHSPIRDRIARPAFVRRRAWIFP
ncbi:MAG: hypothetical protein JSS45_12470 [Proteobacteria bacterium]|nr:hypothetical protein [Pseudomonadota bacterium]